MTLRSLKSRCMYAGQTSAYATPASPATVLPRVQSVTPIREWTKIFSRGLGEGAYPSAALLSTFTCGATVVFELTPEGIPFLRHWVGPLSGSGTSGTPYVLTESDEVSLSSSTGIQVFTFEVADTSESTSHVDTYHGCVGVNYSLSASIDGVVTCEATFVARSVVTNTTATSYTPVTTPPFVCLGGTYSWGATPSSLSGVQSFTVNHTNDLIADNRARSLESPFIEQPVVGQKLYTFSYDLKMSQGLQSTIVDEFYAATNQPEDGTTTVVSPADNEFKITLVNATRNCIVWMDQCHIERLNDVRRISDGIVVLGVEGTALNARSNTPFRWWSS